ncbi:MAG: M23 family metallopeptidase [Chloroflexi bacterium]|nr:M23 family metallopeptidase [Chloroflexota bacterium]
MPLKAGAVQFDAGMMHPDISAVTVQTCDVQTEDYCIANGHFIFQEPVDPLYADPLAKNYKYASNDNGKRETHRGVDFSAAVHTPVLAAEDGEVVFAGMEKSKTHSPWVNYYGNFIVIRHANELYTLYAHLSRIDVEAGQAVQAGEVIGGVGRTGAAIGPHLHFEVRRGANGENFYSTENPELWLVLEKDGNGEAYGALSIQFDAGLNRKVQRNLVVEYYPTGSKTPETVIHTYTYPVGFENNQEDAVLSNLQPGRYRIVVSGSEGVRDRWVYVESGMLTKVYMSPR